MAINVAEVKIETEDRIARLNNQIKLARLMRADPKQSTTVYLLCDTVIEQAEELLDIAHEQLDRCGILVDEAA